MESPSDFCNAFWNGSKAIEDLRAFYRDRAQIEEEYSKKLGRLAKQHLGKEETGSMKAALERVRMETGNVADAHEKLANMIRVSLEAKTKEFESSREARRRNPQAAIEKLLKTKQQQEAMVSKARDKYKQDCIAINGYTAQTSLVQGRDLDRVSAKLDKAQAGIQVNEKEYKAYLNALRETTSKFNLDWKSFADLAQDLEEERLNYLRVSLWEYANGHSFICVTDDEYCENIRQGLEKCDAVIDLLDFVKRNATGNKIPDPPTFVNFASGDGSTPKITFRNANFQRSSAKVEIVHTGQSLQDLATAIKPTSTGQMNSRPQSMRQQSASSNRSRSQSRSRPSSERSASREDLQDRPSVQTIRGDRDRDITPRKGHIAESGAPIMKEPEQTEAPYSESQEAIRKYANIQPSSSLPTMQSQAVPSQQSPVRPSATEPSAAKDLKPLPDRADEASKSPAPSVSTFGVKSNSNKQDPIAMALAALRDPSRASEAAEKYSPLIRQKSKGSFSSADFGGRKDSTPDLYPTTKPAQGSSTQRHSVSAASNPQRQSFQAEPSQQQSHRPFSYTGGASSRPHSPAMINQQRPHTPSQAPVATMMQASHHHQQQQHMARSQSPAILQQRANEQSNSRSRANSVVSSKSGRVPQQTTSHPQMQYDRNQQSPYPGQAPPSNVYMQQPAGPQQQSTRPVSPRPNSYAPQTSQGTYNAGPSAPQPNTAGRPISPAYHNAYASPVPNQQRPMTHQTHPSQSSLRQQAQSQATEDYSRGYQPANRPTGEYARGANQQQPIDYSRSTNYANVNGIPTQQSQPQLQNLSYTASPNLTPAQMIAQQYSQQPQHQPINQMARPTSVSSLAQPSYQQPVRSPSPAQGHMAASQSQPINNYQQQPVQMHPPSQLANGANGRPVLFFVRAMYDYQAQIPEEFSFQADDVIAVFATDPDGWWQGELLDDTRKHLGGNTFPSNFCTLLE